MKRKHGSHWRQRRVAFIVSNSYHVITPVSVKMPVRVRGRGETKTVYEGPIAAKWEWVKRQLNADDELVGVLFANDEQLDFGRIDWLEQSEINEVEAGADAISVDAEE